MKRYFINDNWSTYKDSNALFFDLQFAFKGGFNVVRKLLENEELDAPVSTWVFDEPVDACTCVIVWRM